MTYARTLWENVEGYNVVRTIGPDKYFNYKLLSRDPLVAYVPHVLYRYSLLSITATVPTSASP